jgi:hypothetical protein
MNEVQQLMDEAGKEFLSKNPNPGTNDAQTYNAWSAGYNAARTLAFDNYALRKKAAWEANQASGGRTTPEAQAKGKAAYNAVFDMDNARRAMDAAIAVANNAATSAIYGPPNSKEARDALREAMSNSKSKAIYYNRIQKAVDENPSVIAARAAVSTLLANNKPPEQRAAWLNSDSNVFSPRMSAYYRAQALKQAGVSDAEANKLVATVVAQTQSATGPTGTTPVAPPKPPKKAPKKPLSKPKGRR